MKYEIIEENGSPCLQCTPEDESEHFYLGQLAGARRLTSYASPGVFYIVIPVSDLMNTYRNLTL